MLVTVTCQTTDGLRSLTQRDVPIEDVLPSLAGIFAGAGEHNIVAVMVSPDA